MELNGINSGVYQTAAYPTKETKEATTSTAPVEKVQDTAVVYEKSEQTEVSNKNPKVDQKLIDQLKADAEARYSQLASLVEKLMTKQGQTAETAKYATLSDLMMGVKNGEVQVDPEIVEQAKKDVDEGGYWSVEETAKRIVSFAKALTGGDASKMEEMRAAVEKGFGGAKEAWGGDMPEITEKTYNRVNELLDEWGAETTA